MKYKSWRLPQDTILLTCCCYSIKAGGGAYADPAQKRLGSAELDFAEQTGREDLESGEKSAAAGTQAFQAGHLSPVCQTEVAAETLAARQANGGGRGGHIRGNCPTSTTQMSTGMSLL